MNTASSLSEYLKETSQSENLTILNKVHDIKEDGRLKPLGQIEKVKDLLQQEHIFDDYVKAGSALPIRNQGESREDYLLRIVDDKANIKNIADQITFKKINEEKIHAAEQQKKALEDKMKLLNDENIDLKAQAPKTLDPKKDELKRIEARDGSVQVYLGYNRIQRRRKLNRMADKINNVKTPEEGLATVLGATKTLTGFRLREKLKTRRWIKKIQKGKLTPDKLHAKFEKKFKDYYPNPAALEGNEKAFAEHIKKNADAYKNTIKQREIDKRNKV